MPMVLTTSHYSNADFMWEKESLTAITVTTSTCMMSYCTCGVNLITCCISLSLKNTPKTFYTSMTIMLFFVTASPSGNARVKLFPRPKHRNIVAHFSLFVFIYNISLHFTALGLIVFKGMESANAYISVGIGSVMKCI